MPQKKRGGKPLTHLKAVSKFLGKGRSEFQGHEKRKKLSKKNSKDGPPKRERRFPISERKDQMNIVKPERIENKGKASDSSSGENKYSLLRREGKPQNTGGGKKVC